MTVHALHPVALATTAADDAHRVAYADRDAAANLVLSMAVVDAIDLIREGRPKFAEFRLTRALCSAQRILGQSQRPEGGGR